MVTINDSGGQSAHATVSVSTTVTPPPPTLTVSINANPTSGRVGDTVIFTSTVTGGIAGTKTYAWDFGDSDTSAASNPAHTYNSVGNFTAKLTVTDSGSNSASATQIITIAVFPPQVAWSSPTDNSTSTAPATFSLGAVAIANGGATITGVSFYRGGSTLIHAATLVAGVWTYSWTGVTAGDYTLTAKATDSSAATSTSTPIMVHVLTAGTVQVPQLIYVTP
jgi:PKD repeat protein